MRARAALTLALVLAGCGTGEPAPSWPETPAVPAATGAAAPVAGAAPSGDPSVDPAEAAENARRSQKMLEVVSRLRQLPVKKAVPGKTLGRGKMLERIRAHVDEDVPRAVLFDQGESLAALGLVPADYDFVEGIFALLEGQIAGFYEPEDGTMYLADDLGEEEATATLAHELVHALQDQSFDLGNMLDYKPGEGDRTTAGHALAEGDAMVAMFDVMAGGPTDIPVEAVRLSAAASMAMSASAAATPRALQASLMAPYVDGFRLVQAVRKRGGWSAVDAVWRKLPETTEQLLHVEKLDAREPPLKVATPPIASLGSEWKVTLEDAMGEQALRITLADWSSNSVAEMAAAGWGGDRYVVVRRGPAPPTPPPGSPIGPRPDGDIAMAWSLVMDTEPDAAEVASVLARHWGGSGGVAKGASGCKERADVGPFAWARKGKALAMVAGPFQRAGKGAKALSECKAAVKWAAEVLASAGAAGAPKAVTQ